MRRILFLEPQPCIRALKLAYGLKWLLGKEISLVFGYQSKTLTEFYGHGDEFFDEFVLLSKDNPEKSISESLKRYNPDIIHSHSAGGYAYIVMLLGFHPFIITPWGSDVLIDIQKSKIEKFFTTLSLKKADVITCDGENTKEAMINLGISSQKIKFITFGVDIQKFKTSTKKEDFRNNLKCVNPAMKKLRLMMLISLKRWKSECLQQED